MIDDFAIYNIKIGLIKIGYEDDFLVSLTKIDEIIENGIKSSFTDKVNTQLNEYFLGERKQFDIKYKLKGTEFQIKVSKELLKIPYGETRSYKDIAIKIGNPAAFRAVGNANNKNPIAIIIPCHRVIGVNGKLMGYRGGLSMKKSLLSIEKLNIEE